MPKKNYRKKRYNKKRKSRVPRPNAILTQQSAIVRMKYSDTITLNPGTTDIALAYLFHTNSIYDPDYSGIGHQPLGHDDMAQFFLNYTVKSSHITCEASALKTGNPMMLAIHRSGDTSAANLSNRINLMETSNGFVKQLPVDGTLTRLRMGYNKQRNFASSKDVNNTALFGVAPAEQSYFRISAINAVYAQAPSPVQIRVTIWYNCLLTERKPLATS